MDFAFLFPCLSSPERDTISAFWNVWGAPLPSAVPLALFNVSFPESVLSGAKRRASFFAVFALEIVTIDEVELVVTTNVGLWQDIAEYALDGGSFSPSDCQQGLFL